MPYRCDPPVGLRWMFFWLGAAALMAELAAASDFLVRTWQTIEGLPNNSQSGVCQSTDGYLWISTNSGVARFDGIRFVNFGAQDGLPSANVRSIFNDSRGRIWAGTQNGVAMRDGGRWTLPKGKWPDGAIWSISETTDGSIWFGADRGVWQWQGGSLRHWTEGLPQSPVRCVQAAADGSLWIVSRDGISRWVNGRLEAVPSLFPWIDGREMWGIVPTPDGQWIVHGDGVLIKGDGGRWQDLSEEMPQAEGAHIACVASANGALWVATRNHGLAYRKNRVWMEISAASGLSHDDVRSLMEDREGNLWVSTNGGGINRVRPRGIDVYGLSGGLGRHVTTALVSDAAGKLWAGTDGGGVKMLVDGRFVSALPDHAVPDPYIWSLCAGRDGNLWIGTYQSGVYQMRGGVAQVMSRPTGAFERWIPALMEDRSGKLWTGAHSGAIQSIEHGITRMDRPSSPGSDPSIRDLLEDHDGFLWAATADKGLLRRSDGQWREFGMEHGLLSTSIATLHEDTAGRLWVGTMDAGLALLRGKTFAVWNPHHGLASNAVLQILDDGHGGLWLGTDNGLQRVVIDDLLAVAEGKLPRLSRVELYSRDEGLPSPQFSGGHGNLCTRTLDGSLWFSHVAGAVRVPPEMIEKPDSPLPHLQLQLESVGADGQLVWQHDRPDSESENVALDWPVDLLEIKFTAPSFSAQEKIRFRYRLEGLGEAWRDSEGRRSATFFSLPPGSFRFEVNAARPGEPWAELTSMLPITIRPRYWQTLRFRIATAIVGAVAVAVLARWWVLLRVRRRMAVLEQDRRIQGERARIAQDLHDDLGATLTEINFLGSLGAATADSPLTRQRLEGIVERAQRMAKSLDEIVWTVNPENDSLSSTVNYLCSRTQESLATAGIACRLEIAGDLPELPLDSALRHHLLMAVNEAVNNVMKHAGASELKLSVSFESGILKVRVADDGCGFDPDRVPPGRNGLCNLRKRVVGVGGSCEIESMTGGGTRVILELPIVDQPQRPILPTRNQTPIRDDDRGM